MTDFNDEYDEYAEEVPGGNAPQGTDLVKDLRKQLSAKSTAEKEAREELAALRDEIRKDRVGRVLGSKGVNEKVANLIPSEVTTEEDVNKWLADYSDVFGIQPESKPSEVATPEEIAQQQRVAELTATSGQPANSGRVTEADIHNVQSLDELLALLKKG